LAVIGFRLIAVTGFSMAAGSYHYVRDASKNRLPYSGAEKALLPEQNRVGVTGDSNASLPSYLELKSFR